MLSVHGCSSPGAVPAQGTGAASHRLDDIAGDAAARRDVEAGRPSPFSATKVNNLYRLRVGKEHYEVVEAVIFGG